MSYYINQKCGACNKSLTDGYVSNYSGIGEPFIVCEKCGAINNNSDRITEWKLKSPSSRSWFILLHVWSVLFYYGGGSVLLSAILLAKDVINSPPEVVAVIVGSVSFGLFLFYYRLTNSIKKSNARMSDPSYVEKLNRLGIR